MDTVKNGNQDKNKGIETNMRKIYDKLVRDKIPEIINLEGKLAVTRKLNKEEKIQYLYKKLIEELNEYLESEEQEEIADINEVLNEICIEKGFKQTDIMEIQKQKCFQRGSFSEGILLEYVEEK